jgi:DNA-binding response OmpR family regulator
MRDNEILQTGGSASASLRGMRNPRSRILLVDDDRDIRRLTAQMLTRFGYHVDAAEDGAAAWDTLQLNSYNLLLTDQNMPKVSGVELVKKLRSARMALPVIMASGAIPAEELKRHPWLEISAILLKPFTSEELLGAVEKALHTTDIDHKPIAPRPNWPRQTSTDARQLCESNPRPKAQLTPLQPGYLCRG